MVNNCSPLKTFAFNAGTAPSLGDLKTAVGEVFGVAPDGFVLAKKTFGSWQWVELKPNVGTRKVWQSVLISSHITQKGKGKKKKKSPQQTSLLDPPYKVGSEASCYMLTVIAS